MIVELSVENLAIIEEARLELGSGFTVLTGETGAGKSLLIDAIELALGERADTELVRTGAPRASVNVVLDLSGDDPALATCAEFGVELEDGLLYIQREVAAEGRSQCRIGGKMTPVSVLRQLGKQLVDLHGQHQHQSLLDTAQHIGYLDAWIGERATLARAGVSAAHATFDSASKRLQELRSGLRDREQRIDLLRYQVNEIESVSPVEGELDELRNRLSRLKHTEKLANASFGAIEILQEGESCAIDQLGAAITDVDQVLQFDPSLEGPLAKLREAWVEAQEAARELRSYADSLEADPAALDAAAARMDELTRLRRKYGDDEAQILQFLEDARSQLALLEDSETSEQDLLAECDRASQLLRQTCVELSMLRKAGALEFAELVQAQLRDLAMDRALFEVTFREREPSASGLDDVEFYFSANAGEIPRPLSKIASGGEVSRVMLAIKCALAGRAGVPTLVFDEIDAGLGGRAAATVANKLEELGQHYQVLVISHLPQIASRATSHYRIEKVESNGRAATRVRPLAASERAEEIARMLSGEHVSSSSLAAAREMLGNRAPAGNLFD